MEEIINQTQIIVSRSNKNIYKVDSQPNKYNSNQSEYIV